MKPQLKTYRRQLDKIDRQLLTLLAKRFSTCAKIGQIKKASGLPIVDSVRERTVINNRRLHARSLGIPTTWATKLFRLIINYSRQTQK